MVNDGFTVSTTWRSSVQSQPLSQEPVIQCVSNRIINSHMRDLNRDRLKKQLLEFLV